MIMIDKYGLYVRDTIDTIMINECRNIGLKIVDIDYGASLIKDGKGDIADLYIWCVYRFDKKNELHNLIPSIIKRNIASHHNEKEVTKIYYDNVAPRTTTVSYIINVKETYKEVVDDFKTFSRKQKIKEFLEDDK